MEVKESDGRDDRVVADEQWRGHLLRNQSVIVDLFQGQLKSTIRCPDCPKIRYDYTVNAQDRVAQVERHK